MSKPFRFSFPLSFEKQSDGSMLVFGTATSEALDSQGQVLDFGGSVQALSEWFKSGPNVREQHDEKKAAGSGIEIRFDKDGKKIKVTSRISKGAWETQAKLEDKTLRCYSVGGRPIEIIKEQRHGVPIERVMKWEATELSVVDRGANPDCEIQLMKGATMTKVVAAADEKKSPEGVVAKEAEDMALCSKCDKAFPLKDKVDGSAMCPKCRGGEKAAEPEAEKVAAPAPAPEEKPAEKAAEPEVKKDSVTAAWDVRDALDCLQGLRSLRNIEASETEPKGKEQLAFLDAAILNVKQFIASEAGELLEPDPGAAASMEMAAKPGEVQKAAGAEIAPLLVPLAEKVDGLTKTVGAIMEKLNAPVPPAPVAPAPDGGMIEKSLSPVLSQVSELSKAIGDLKALPGEVKALAEKVEQMGKRPAVGGPLARFAPGAVVKAAAGSPTERVAVLEDLISGAPEASRPHLLVELNRAKAAARQSEGV